MVFIQASSALPVSNHLCNLWIPFSEGLRKLFKKYLKGRYLVFPGLYGSRSSLGSGLIRDFAQLETGGAPLRPVVSQAGISITSTRLLWRLRHLTFLRASGILSKNMSSVFGHIRNVSAKAPWSQGSNWWWRWRLPVSPP